MINAKPGSSLRADGQQNVSRGGLRGLMGPRRARQSEGSPAANYPDE
jgi:hypothetical protein